MTRLIPALLTLPLLLAGCDTTSAQEEAPETSFAVSGTGVHYFTTAVVHSQTPTETGMVQRSSDIIRLAGDINGYILYHPTSVIDSEAGALVNTGTQVFSGTVKESDPVLLHDDTYRFESDLATGATTGTVRLGPSDDAPAGSGWFVCDLDVVGTGLTSDGDATVDYTGTCRTAAESEQ